MCCRPRWRSGLASGPATRPGARASANSAQGRFVAGHPGIGEPPPREGEVHTLGMQQSQPVAGQRGIGVIVAMVAIVGRFAFA